MIFVYEITNLVTVTWSYMFIYNISLYVLFLTLFQYIHAESKTIYSFLDLGALNFFSKVLIIALFSMAGVPPFWGFFSKIFIFTLLANSNFFLFFPFFFIILFIGLYFYIQNIRFLNSTSGANFTPIIEWGARTSPVYYNLTYFFLFFLIFGLFFTEELLLVMSWILF